MKKDKNFIKSQISNIKNIHPKISTSIETMLMDPILKLEYYGEFLQYVNFFETKELPTCGVNFTSYMNFYYNPTFIDSISQMEVNFVVIHELYHLIYNHVGRTTSAYDHNMANIVQDMIINSTIIEGIPSKFVKTLETIKLHFIPEEYNGDRIFEILYDWVMKEKNKYQDWKDSQDGQDGQGNGQDSQDSQGNGQGKCPVSEELKKIFEDSESDSFDEHMKDECSEGLREEIIKDVTENLKQRGLESAEITSTLEKLIKKRKDYLKEIKRGISSIKGTSKISTFRKLNRRNIKGLKGKVKESYVVNCILDTSGSMCGYFEKIISYIFQDKCTINLIQCDSKVQGVTILNSLKDFKDLNIKGHGGTELQPSIDFIVSDKEMKKINTIVLTDGYCDSLNFSKIKKTLVLTCGIKCEIVSGNVRQVVID